MAITLDGIEQQAQKLSAEEKAKRAELLLDSVRPSIADIEAAWADEIENRVAAFDRGEILTYQAEDVFAEAGSSEFMNSGSFTL